MSRGMKNNYPPKPMSSSCTTQFEYELSCSI